MTQPTSRLNPGAPVRKIRSGHRGIRGTASVLRKPVAFESALERDFLVLLSVDPNLAEVREQPVRIDFHDAVGRAHHYTPDFLVLYDAERPQQVLYEIKYRADLRAEWPRLKPAFLAARRHARERGDMRFSIMTEVEIRGPYLANVRFLRGYRDRPCDEAVEEHLVRTLAALGETTPRALLAAYWDRENRIAAIAPLWRLLATGRVHADLFQPLTMTTPIWVIVGEGFL
jgi:hypothetical protein